VKRPPLVHTQSTFQQRSYAKLVEGPDMKLIDERALMLRGTVESIQEFKIEQRGQSGKDYEEFGDIARAGDSGIRRMRTDVASGERVETVITIEAKNNYEYLLFEDLKPAGLEAVELRSGASLQARELKSGAAARKFAAYPETLDDPEEPRELLPEESANYTGRRRQVYQELRDRNRYSEHSPPTTVISLVRQSKLARFRRGSSHLSPACRSTRPAHFFCGESKDR
jgi:hypothetical protein